MAEQSRRAFLKVLATGAGTAAGAAVLGRCGGWAVNPADAVKGGVLDLAGQVTFSATQFSELTKAGGAVLLDAPGVGYPILVVRVTDTAYSAMYGLCSHLGCPVGYVADKKYVECPCHGARYDLQGHVLRAPATFGLAQFPVRTDPSTGDIVVDTNGVGVPALDMGVVTFTIDGLTVADLSAVDDTATFTPLGMQGPILVLRAAANQVLTFDADCTFAPCILAWDKSQQLLQCACHGCAFDITGAVRQGPARTNLRVYATTFDGTTVQISVGSR